MSSENPIVERAADFVWRNARLLDRRRFSHLFAGGPSEAVISTLMAYQNADGGFGNALEPDKRCPDSQPVDVETALRVLDDLGDVASWRETSVGARISSTPRLSGLIWLLLPDASNPTAAGRSRGRR